MVKSGTDEYKREQRSEVSNCSDLIHAPISPDRRAACEFDFKLFCLTYFPLEFRLEFSPDHLKVIDKIERVVLKGELFALAMPRGSGKTTLCEKAVEWATLYGHRQFVCLVGSDKDASQQILESILTDYESNDLLEEDFSEVCGPIQALEGRSQRCASQHYNNKSTNIRAKADCMVYATIDCEWATGCGSIIRAYGLTGRIRGAKYKLESGETIRPDLVIIDDPQTDATASSNRENDKREEALSGAILNLAGPDKKIASIMPCTVIKYNDMADRVLNRELHPEWQSERMKALYAWPENMERWEDYNQVRKEGLRVEDGGDMENAFYTENSEILEAGAVVGWEQRVKDGDVSALQSLMNFYFQDEKAFFAEFQNEPQKEQGDESNLEEDEVKACIRTIEPSVVPGWAGDLLTGGVDVHDDLLFWVVCSWGMDNFSGHLVDYGVWPHQRGAIRQGNTTYGLKEKYPGCGVDGAIFKGLCDVLKTLTAKEYQSQAGEFLQTQHGYVDTGYRPDTICQAIIESADLRIIQPSIGQYVGAKNKPIGDNKANKAKRERIGEGWRERKMEKYNKLRRVSIDTNYWKSFFRSRMQTQQGDSGAFSIYKGTHETLIDHLLAEKSVMVEASGRKVEEWSSPPGADNHWFDCIVEAIAAAGVAGCKLSDGQSVKKRSKQKSTKGWFQKAKGGPR